MSDTPKTWRKATITIGGRTIPISGVDFAPEGTADATVMHAFDYSKVFAAPHTYATSTFSLEKIDAFLAEMERICPRPKIRALVIDDTLPTTAPFGGVEHEDGSWRITSTAFEKAREMCAPLEEVADWPRGALAAGFARALRASKGEILVGAHQLGVPVYTLAGWLDLEALRLDRNPR